MTTQKIISWNVNSVRARLPLLLYILEREDPDIILLQETKCVDQDFPDDAFSKYNIAKCGQKSYNGVAILSKEPIENVRHNLDKSEQKRYIEGWISGIWVASVYVPLGSFDGKESQVEYKKQFFQLLTDRWEQSVQNKIPVVLGGDFNVAYSDLDVEPLHKWKDTTICHPTMRSAFGNLLKLFHNESTQLNNNKYHTPTWWDYRNRKIQGEGLRIDYLLQSVNMTQEIRSAVEYRWIKDFECKPSDHVPLILTINQA